LIDAPDAFGFYRPVTQGTLAISPGVRGSHPAQARAFNVAVHALVIAMAFIVARLVLSSPSAAGLATLAFALTPKAPSIAVLWISARGELLMALFSLAALAAWMVWTRRGRWWWLAAALAAYGLAILSKETATLLPVLLLLTPRSERPLAARAGAVTGFIVLALVIYAWRSQTGALTPFAGDEHYSPEISVALWLRNGINYAGRMIAAPLGLLAILGLARLSFFRRAEASAFAKAPADRSASASEDSKTSLVFAAACVVVFLTPVLPISLRSELYLYLPVFGVCLFAGWLGSLLSKGIQSRWLAVAVAVSMVGLGGYQIARARDVQQDLRFSENLVTALRRNSLLAGTTGSVVLIPSDHATERSLQSAIGGYLYVVLQYAFDGPPRVGAVQYGGEPPRQADIRLTASYRTDGSVVISPGP
jgi:4-amino-4-deoxy-L-arabinose transferase-like glycosyltransferase